MKQMATKIKQAEKVQRPVQYHVVVGLSAMLAGVSALITIHHLFFLLFMVSGHSKIDFLSPFVFGHALITAPLAVGAGIVSVVLYSLAEGK